MGRNRSRGPFRLDNHAQKQRKRLEEKIREERKEQKIMTSAKRDTTVVLVHAAWADGSSWNKVTGELQREGFNVVAAQIPLTSLTDDVAVLQSPESSGGNLRLSTSCSAPFSRPYGRRKTQVHS